MVYEVGLCSHNSCGSCVYRIINGTDPMYWLKILLCLFSTVLIQGGFGLKDVRLQLPNYVMDGSDACLSCKYNMEGDALYAVKWYKESHEFYRYIPKEVPPIQVFPVAGLNVDVRRSNDHDVVLSRVTLDSAGTYKCVVSAESPFQTLPDSRDLLVLLIGDDKPSLQLDRSQYHPGDTVTVQCHVPASLPSPPNITWYLNDQIISDGGDLVRTTTALTRGLSKKTGAMSTRTMTNNTSDSSNNNRNSPRKNTSQYHQHNHQMPASVSMSSSISSGIGINNNRASSSSASSLSDRYRDFTENGGMLESVVSFDLPGNVTPVQIKCRARIYTAYDENVTIPIVPVLRRFSGPDTLLRSSGLSTLQISPLLLRPWALLDWWPSSTLAPSIQTISSSISIVAIIVLVLTVVLQVPVHHAPA